MPALRKARQNWPSAALSVELIQRCVQQHSLPDAHHGLLKPSPPTVYWVISARNHSWLRGIGHYRWQGKVIWCYLWSQENSCVSEYTVTTSPFLCTFISHWPSFFSHHTCHHFAWIQERPRKRLLSVLASQRDKALSAELVRTVMENGRNSMWLTESSWPNIACLHFSLQEKEKKTHHPKILNLPFRIIIT